MDQKDIMDMESLTFHKFIVISQNKMRKDYILLCHKIRK